MEILHVGLFGFGHYYLYHSKEGFFVVFTCTPSMAHAALSVPSHILNFPHYRTCCTVISICLSAPTVIPAVLCLNLVHCYLPSAELMVGGQKILVG